jgi:DnaK suppressor protein
MHKERYRTLLLEKADELRRALGRRGEMVIERASDDLDETLLAAQREALVSDLERTYRQLRQVEFALKRFDSGNYGVCFRCEGAISDKRLRAVPWAVYCIECQEAVDRLHDRMDALRRPAA